MESNFINKKIINKQLNNLHYQQQNKLKIRKNKHKLEIHHKLNHYILGVFDIIILINIKKP